MFEDITRKSVVRGMVDLAEHITFLTEVLNCWERVVKPTKKEIMEFVEGELKEIPTKVGKKKKLSMKQIKKRRARQKTLYDENPEYYREKSKKYYDAHKEEIAERRKERRKAKKEKK